MSKPLRIGIGGPVGSGKTALVDALCKTMRDRYRLGVDHQRHLHARGHGVPRAQRGAVAGSHHRRADRRLPAHRDPRGRVDELRRARRDDGAPSRSRHRLSRERRRQPRRQLQPGAGRRVDLRHRRVGRRQDPAQRAARASRARICSSSTRSISRRTSAPTSTSWRATRRRCAASGRSCSPTSRRGDGLPDVIAWIRRELLYESGN